MFCQFFLLSIQYAIIPAWTILRKLKIIKRNIKNECSWTLIVKSFLRSSLLLTCLISCKNKILLNLSVPFINTTNIKQTQDRCEVIPYSMACKIKVVFYWDHPFSDWLAGFFVHYIGSKNLFHSFCVEQHFQPTSNQGWKSWKIFCVIMPHDCSWRK